MSPSGEGTRELLDALMAADEKAYSLVSACLAEDEETLRKLSLASVQDAKSAVSVVAALTEICGRVFRNSLKRQEPELDSEGIRAAWDDSAAWSLECMRERYRGQ